MRDSSGVGRLAAQIYLDNAGGGCMTKSVGVELSAARHGIAADALRRLRRSVPIASGIEFVHANALEADLREATHLYLSSLCFSESVLIAVCTRLLTEAPQLLAVAALSDLEPLSAAGWARTSLEVQMSWGSAWVRLYKRRHQTPPQG